MLDGNVGIRKLTPIYDSVLIGVKGFQPVHSHRDFEEMAKAMINPLPQNVPLVLAPIRFRKSRTTRFYPRSLAIEKPLTMSG